MLGHCQPAARAVEYDFLWPIDIGVTLFAVRLGRSPCGLHQHVHTRILPSFSVVSEKVVGERFQVFNLSDASRIPADVIPKVDLNELDRLIDV